MKATVTLFKGMVIILKALRKGAHAQQLIKSWWRTERAAKGMEEEFEEGSCSSGHPPT